MKKKFNTPDELNEELSGQQAEDEKFEQVLSNAYFFGQFMMMHILFKIQSIKGNEGVFTFMKKKYSDIGKTHSHFLTQAIKNDDLIKQYYEDTMESKF